MCLGDFFGSIFTPCMGCCKYLGSGCGLALVFTAGLVGLDLAADWPIVLILIACIVALIWFILAYCCGGLKDKEDEELNYMLRYFGPMCDPKANLAISGQIEINGEARSYAHELGKSCQEIDCALMDIFIIMFYHALIILLIFILLTVWFIGFHLGFLLSLLIGVCVITLVFWFALKFASRSLSRILIHATQVKEEAFILMFSAGFGAIMLSVALIYFFFVICFLLFKKGIVEGLPDTKDADTIGMMGVYTCGYAMGIVVPAFVYREASSVFARGIFNTLDGIVKTDSNLSFNNPYLSHPTKLLYVIQSLLSNQVVNLLDSCICIVVLSASAFVILSNSEELIAEDITYKALLSPTIFLSLNVLFAVIVQLFKTWFDDGETAGFTMYNCRLQVILTNIVSFFIFLMMPAATFLEEATLKGQDADASLASDLTMTRFAWACILGQMCCISLICLIEWLTSHGCSPNRNLTLSTTERVPNQNINYAHYLGEVGGLGCFLIIAITIIAVYSMCGWSGFMAAACGFIINLIIYMPILYVGAMAADAHKICQMGIVNQIVTDRIYKMAWAARNYSIYVRISNAGGAIMLSLCFLGSSMFFFKKDPNIFVNGVGLFGLVLGVALTLAIRGWTIAAIIAISKIYDLSTYKSGVTVEVTDVRNPTMQDYIRHKIWTTMKFIYTAFIFITILILLVGFLFGYQATIGIMLGTILITMFLMFHSIVCGTSLRNGRHYMEANTDLSKKTLIYNHYVYADTTATVIEESSSIPLIIYMLYIVLLIASANAFFGRDGDVFQPAAE